MKSALSLRFNRRFLQVEREKARSFVRDETEELNRRSVHSLAPLPMCSRGFLSVCPTGMHAWAGARRSRIEKHHPIRKRLPGEDMDAFFLL